MERYARHPIPMMHVIQNEGRKILEGSQDPSRPSVKVIKANAFRTFIAVPWMYALNKEQKRRTVSSACADNPTRTTAFACHSERFIPSHVVSHPPVEVIKRSVVTSQPEKIR
jgi:hypothetical protein